MNERKIQPALPAASIRDTVILQCLAALLIANSHLEGLYPRSWMAADGLIGNSLFFFMSGYGLMKSEQKNHRPFLNYYMRRVWRIYPALWLVVILFQLGMGETWKLWGAADYFRWFIYPTAYGYIQQIMIFYIPFFFLARLHRPKVLMWPCLALVIPYVFRYILILPPGGIVYLKLGNTDGWLWDIFYFQMMLVGGCCGFHPCWRFAIRELSAIWLLAAAFAAYVGLKFAMVVNGALIPGTSVPLGDFYALLLFLTMVIVLLMFQVFTSSLVRSWVASIAPLKWFVALTGGLTLEIYLSHEFIAYNALMKTIPFPLNIVIWLAVTLCASWVIGKIARHIQRRYERL
jgi:peptidoglycan/LPS O-acetylase OafA/YrhL